jgi:hypothetical protein
MNKESRNQSTEPTEAARKRLWRRIALIGVIGIITAAGALFFVYRQARQKKGAEVEEQVKVAPQGGPMSMKISIRRVGNKVVFEPNPKCIDQTDNVFFDNEDPQQGHELDLCGIKLLPAPSRPSDGCAIDWKKKLPDPSPNPILPVSVKYKCIVHTGEEGTIIVLPVGGPIPPECNK